MNSPQLILLTGPVGAGKSTTGLAVAAHLRTHERRTATIDLDQIYYMVRQQGMSLRHRDRKRP